MNINPVNLISADDLGKDSKIKLSVYGCLLGERIRPPRLFKVDIIVIEQVLAKTAGCAGCYRDGSRANYIVFIVARLHVPLDKGNKGSCLPSGC